MSDLKSHHLKWIEEYALKSGFLEVKPVTLEKDPNFEVYKNWIQQGHHKPLKYLEKNLDKRENPKRLGSQLHSALVFLYPYPKEFQSRYISKYAWGKDYHFQIKSKLQKLSKDFQSEWNNLNEEKVCVDTVPLLERSLAQRAGLGWIGKNGCLLSRKHGSFFFISCWLISLTLDTPQQKSHFHCGSCTRCIEACPTDAFLEPGLLEIELCLSTQTIENRKEIPPQFHPHLKENVFGCDICQDVCPWNRKRMYKAEHESLPSLKNLLEMEEPHFRDFFRDTPMTRPGWAGLKRNFLIAASHDSTIPNKTFEIYLKHNNPLLQQTAQQILNTKRNK